LGLIKSKRSYLFVLPRQVATVLRDLAIIQRVVQRSKAMQLTARETDADLGYNAIEHGNVWKTISTHFSV
jgi:hypothetical protein